MSLEAVFGEHFRRRKNDFYKQLKTMEHFKGHPETTRRKARDLLKKFRPHKISQTMYESILGKTNMYASVMETLLTKAVLAQHPGRMVLIFESANMMDAGEKYRIDARFYFAPEVMFPLDWDPKSIAVTTLERTPEEMEALVARQVELVLDRSVEPKEKDGTIEAGDAALCTITATTPEGKAREDVCFKHRTVYTGKHANKDPLFAQYSGMLVGQSAGTVSQEVSWKGDTVTLHVQVIRVFSVEQIPIEDVAKKEGFDTVEAWKAEMEERFRKAEKAQARQATQIAIENTLHGISKMSPVPSNWVVSRTNDMYQSMLLKSGAREEVFLKQLGCENRDRAYGRLAQRLVEMFRKEMLLRAYAEAVGLETSKTLEGDTGGVIESVLSWAEENLSITKISDAEQQEEFKRQREAAVKSSEEEAKAKEDSEVDTV